MASLITELRRKTRALCSDFSTKGVETFTYSSGDKVFILQEEYPDDITSVTVNGVALGSGTYSYDTDTNELTISGSGLVDSGDVIVVRYTYYKYSNSEIDEYVRGALAWISLFAFCASDFEFEDDDVYPTPTSKEEDLIAIISAILIKPNYSEYKLPNITVKYPRTMDKDTKIQRIIEKFYGRIFINSLPKSNIVSGKAEHVLQKVRDFFKLVK